MRLSRALNAICLCAVWPLCVQVGEASAPGNRVERIEASQTAGGRGFGGWSKLVFDQRSGVVECGAFNPAERGSARGAVNFNAFERRTAKRNDVRQRARRQANVCSLPKLID